MAPRQSSQPEYHHFIPQFILRNFSHKYTPSPCGSKSTPGRRKKNKKTNAYPGDSVLNIVDLKDAVPKISESPVNRTFGLMDMYRDISNATDQYYLEKEIGKLESRVSVIIAGIRKALESGKSGISMLRNERDTLRKFLFIMKYRGRGFHRRFHGDKSGSYDADDKEQFNKHMQEKGYKKPVDVWFKSIKTILELEMDLEGKWQKKLLADIYSDDALGFIMHTEWFFLAFCTPNNRNDEFVLTENCYNVHEGPNSTVLDPDTGEYEPAQWTSYHEFSPITPKLMLVLRSVLLPNLEEDIDEGIKKWRREMYEANARLHVDPAATKSILQDLPIKKPQNSYSQVSTEGTQFLPGEDGSRRSYHRFTFPFFKINTGQVHRINCVLLENAYLTSTIAFSSQSSLKDSLEYYLQLPDDQGFKWVQHQGGDVRLTYLRKLESVVKSWGSTVNLTYKTTTSVDDMVVIKKEALKQLQKEMLEHLPHQPSEFMQLYNKLGGSPDTLFTDMEQARIMRFLRIKIDVCTKGFREATREKVRENLRDLFCQLPPRRLWMYLKSLRVMQLSSPGALEDLASKEFMDGPEDVIVKVSHIVRPERLGLLLHFTVMQDIQHRLYPGLNPSSEFALNLAGVERLQKISHLAFGSGSIRNCGIECIQKAAIQASNMLRVTKGYERLNNPVWSAEEKIELLTRSFVRDNMGSLLSKLLPKDTLQELVDVLFGVVYPAFTKNLAR